MRRLAALSALPLLLAACGSDPHHAAPVGGGRIVQIRATDALRFEPATVAAKPGEKVTFEITNTGQLDHEFTIGDPAYQAKHEQEMAGSASPHGGGHGDGNTGASIDVKAGSTARLDYTMPTGTPPVFACHLNRHDDAGMRGTVTYTG